MIVYLLLIALASSYTVDFNKNALINVINNARNNYNLPKIIYNDALHNDLYNFAETVPKSWWFSNTSFTPAETGFAHVPFVYKNKTIFNMGFPKMNHFHAMLREEFKGYKNYRYIFRDTNNGDISKTIKFRFSQGYCFNWKACNKTSYNYYSSCLKKEPPTEGSKSCSWAWQYSPILLERSMKNIACILTDIVGPFSPRIQKNTFFCYSLYEKQINDYPFD